MSGSLRGWARVSERGEREPPDSSCGESLADPTCQPSKPFIMSSGIDSRAMQPVPGRKRVGIGSSGLNES